jgi:hypothetical protein
MSFRDIRSVSSISDIVKRLSEELARERYGRRGEILYILNIYVANGEEDSVNTIDNTSTNILASEYVYDSTAHDFGSYS